VTLIVRVWSLQDGHPVAIVADHVGLTSCMYFLPVHTPGRRHLVSTGNDGAVVFTRVDDDNWPAMEQSKFNERAGAPPLHMLSSVHSPGGRVVAAGGSDGRLRIYVVDADEPRRVFDQQVHAVRCHRVTVARRTASTR